MRNVSRLVSVVGLCVGVLMALTHVPRVDMQAQAGATAPILVIVDSARPTGRYYAEILQGEGLNEFAVVDISAVSPQTLASHGVAILPEQPLTPLQVAMFTDWVNDGGQLIAMRPDKKLAGLLGLIDQSATRGDAYMLFNTASGPGVGLVSQTIQYHGTADLYALADASPLATLYSDAQTPTPSPAATIRAVGTNGGQASAFTFDVARSIINTRQGNPAWAGQDRDGLSPTRSNDLYFGNASGDPQSNYIDFNKITIPQADELQRFLANLIVQMHSGKIPLPRFWYFPFGHKAVVIMTGDDHSNGGTRGRFDQYMAFSAPGCSVENWECIRSTSYVMVPDPLTDAQAQAYTAQGFEVALHVTTNCAGATPASLESFLTTQLAAFSAAHPLVPPPSTNRTHCVAWSGWAAQPKAELNHNIRLDTTYYHYPAFWVANYPVGFLTGSGMPQRFADLDGTVIDVYQAATQMTDESLQQYPATFDTLLDNALGPAGYYGAFTANMHTDVVPLPESDAIVASAQARGVPVVSAKQMLAWLDSRNGSSFQNIAWSGNALTFTIARAAGANGLQAMIPSNALVGQLIGITRNGAVIPFVVRVLGGVSYAVFEGTAGTYRATYRGPTISVNNVSAAEGDSGTSTFTFTASLSMASELPVTVEYDTSDGNAAAGRDYVAQSGTLTFAPGVTHQPISVLVNGDVLQEENETFFLNLRNAVNATIAYSPGVGTILDEDPDGALSINDVSVSEGNNGTVNAIFNVTLTPASGENITVRYATSNGTATAGSDYQAQSGTLTFPSGTTSRTVAVAVNGDSTFEPDETFFVTLSSPVGASLARAQGAGTIVNDDRPDTTPPTIASETPVPGAVEVSPDTPLIVQFSELMNPATITMATVKLHEQGVAADVPVNLVLAGTTATLTPTELLKAGLLYRATVSGSVTDLVGNPLGADVEWTFTVTTAPFTSFTDTTESDFGAGSPDVNTTVTHRADGELALRPALGTDFNGAGLPAGWSSVPWQTGGAARVSGGTLTVNGSRAFGDALYNSGTSVEFVATFDPVPLQHVGLGRDLQGSPWAIFSTRAGDGLYARTNNGSTFVDTLLPGGLLGAPHRFRIDWNTFSVAYSVDGTQVASHAIGITASMRPIASDFAVDAALRVDWLRVTPYVATGTFVSRVIDAGAPAAWGKVSSTSDVPAGTSIAISVRRGNTANPDATWTPFSAVPSSGAPIGGTSRYVQYRATLNTTIPSQTPELQSVRIGATIGSTLSIADATVTEGDAGATDAVFTVTLTPASMQTVTVAFATADASAIAGVDYVAQSGTLTFAPGTTTQTLTVPVNGETLNEPDETFEVSLSAPTNATVTRAQAVGTIRNDDVVPGLSIGDTSVPEGNALTGNAVFTVTLTQASGQTVTVVYATADGTATAGSDYVAASGTLTFPAGVTARTVTVPVNGDTLHEADETVFVNLSAPINATLTKARGVGTIVNDDPLPALAIADVSVNEGQTGTSTAVFTVTLTPVSEQAVTVAYATTDGTATADSDYVPQSGTVTFAPGTTTRTISVAVMGDTTYEADETFTVALSSPTGATLAASQAVGTILNDDAVPAISVGDVSVAEGNTGTTPAAFVVTLSNASAQTITVNYTTNDGTAHAGSDYQEQSGTVTFAPGTTTRPLTVVVNGDTVNEANATFVVTLSSAANATIARAQAVGTILNDDPVPSLSITDVALNEGPSGTTSFTVTASLSSVSGQTVTVAFATADGTATAGSDYVAQSGTLTFPSGTVSRAITILVNGDILNEADELFVVNLSTPSNATISKAQGTCTILNDDPLPALSIDDMSLNEGHSGVTNFAANVMLSAASGRTVTVNYATADGSATAPSDYAAKSGVLTFAPGATLQTIALPVNGDQLVESNETFSIALTTPTNATLGKSQGTETILNDDTLPTITGRSPAPNATGISTDAVVAVSFSQIINPLTFTAASMSLRAAGASTTVPAVIRYGGTTATLTPTSLLTAGTAYTMTIAGTVTDTAGNPLGAAVSWSFTPTAAPLTILGDVTVADFSAGTPDANTTVTQTGDGDVSLLPTLGPRFTGAALPAGWASNVWNAGGTATVGAGVLTVNGASAYESTFFSTGHSLEFVATFSATASAQHVGFGVDLADAPWAIFSTRAGGDLYARTNNGSTVLETFLPGNWLAAPHRFRVDWSPTNAVYWIDGLQVASHPVAITATMRPIASDFVAGGPGISVDWLRLTPYATAGTFTSRVMDAGLVRNWGNIMWTADVPAGTSLQISVRQGNTPAPDATWTAWAAATGSASPIGGRSRYIQYQASLATTDVRLTPVLQAVHLDALPAASLTISDVSVSEGSGETVEAAFTVTLSGFVSQPVSVNYATADGTATVSGSDYVATSGVLTFPVGTTSQQITVTVNGDVVNEADELFFVSLTDAVNATIVKSPAVGTIRNDDPMPEVSIGDVSVQEGNAGTGSAVFTVSLTAVSGQTVTVAYATADGTATAGNDYLARAGMLTFPSGATSQQVTVPLIGDTVFELNETFLVELSQATNASIARGRGTGTIVNDDVDTTSPLIAGRLPTAGAIGVGLGAAVTVQFSETMNPATLTTATFRLRAAGATSDVPAVVNYAGVTATLTPSASLAPGAPYQVIVSAAATDLAGNPLGADIAWNFTTTVISLTFTDTLVADFSGGATDANTVVGQTGDGDVLLKPAEGSDFFGTSLPAGWSSSAWATGGAAVVANGQLTVNGVRAYGDALYGSNRSLEFVATFSATEGIQHVGVGVDLANPPWAIFSTLTGGTLYARTANGASTINTPIPGDWLGAPHRFRIDWNGASVVFFIDGAQVDSHAIAVTGSMRPMASEYLVSGTALSVDWLRMTPYAAAGSFVSRVFDAGSPATWGTASWTADLPAGTGQVLSVRRGATPTPDTAWTPFVQVPESGSSIGGNARYVQYRIDLTSTDPRQTPVVKSVALTATIP